MYLRSVLSPNSQLKTRHCRTSREYPHSLTAETTQLTIPQANVKLPNIVTHMFDSATGNAEARRIG